MHISVQEFPYAKTNYLFCAYMYVCIHCAAQNLYQIRIILYPHLVVDCSARTLTMPYKCAQRERKKAIKYCVSNIHNVHYSDVHIPHI